MSVWSESMMVRNAYKLIPLLVLVGGLSKGIGKGKSLFQFSYTVAVQNEVNTYARRIATDSATDMKTPNNAEEFADYLHANFQKKEGVTRDQTVDMWGNTYVFEADGERARVISPGPDKKLGTSDDLLAEARLTPH